ncbi:hypothetical protein D9M70_622160 [compost metagenome]
MKTHGQVDVPAGLPLADPLNRREIDLLSLVRRGWSDRPGNEGRWVEQGETGSVCFVELREPFASARNEGFDCVGHVYVSA